MVLTDCYFPIFKTIRHLPIKCSESSTLIVSLELDSFSESSLLHDSSLISMHDAGYEEGSDMGTCGSSCHVIKFYFPLKKVKQKKIFCYEFESYKGFC